MNVDKVYVLKLPCPRDLGMFFCKECVENHLEESSNIDYPIKLTEGCGKIEDGKSCGYTWLGQKWCDECIQKNRLSCSHFGEYEVVGTLAYETDF